MSQIFNKTSRLNDRLNIIVNINDGYGFIIYYNTISERVEKTFEISTNSNLIFLSSAYNKIYNEMSPSEKFFHASRLYYDLYEIGYGIIPHENTISEKKLIINGDKYSILLPIHRNY